MHQSKLKRISLAVCLALMPFAASAAGLGKLSVISGLGEPLNAEIELLSTDADELATLAAAIAPEEAYSVQGIERTSVHSAIKVEVAKKSDGSQVLKLTTRQPVSDPFLDMLIQVDWATGRLMREYTALIDPPGYTSQSSQVASSPISQRESAKSYVPPEPAPTKIKAATPNKLSPKKLSSKTKQEITGETKPENVDTPTGESAEYSTRRGDTLHQIATDLQVQGVSLDQMLVGLYRANKNAFDGNMNRLKVGQIIKVPSKDELELINSKEAAAEIRAQSADWNAYRSKLAGMVAESPSQAESKSNQAGSGKITAKAEDKALPESTGPKDVVKLSKNDTGEKTVSANAKAMQDKLNSLQEEATAREKSVKEASERAAALEKQIADMQKLMAIKNQAMAEMQKNAAAKPEPTKAEPPKTEPVKVEPPKPEPPKPVEATKPVVAPVPSTETSKPAAVPEAAKPEAKVPEQAATPEAQPKPKQKKPASAPVVAPPPPEPESGILSSILDNPLVLGGVGGLIVILGGAWAFLRNKRKRNLDGFEQAILTSGGLKANTVFGNTAGGSIDTGSSFLTDFSQSGSGMIDTNDVDPIAEAEVYMAYGRDSQAEEILKDAISKEPKRYELHLKLLEILAARQDTSGFETIAGELYTTLGAGDPTWDKVAEIGRKMEPGNPLYQMSAPTSSAENMVQNQKLDASEFESAEVMTGNSLDFSLDSESAGIEDVTMPQEDEEAATLDFDIGGPTVQPAEEVSFETSLEAEPEPEQVDEKVDSLDFQLDIGAPAADEMADLEGAGIELDLDSTQTIPSLDMGALDVEEIEEEPATAAFDSTMPGLDMPDLTIPTPSEASPVEEDTELSAFDMPLDADEPTVEESMMADISFDVPEIEISATAPQESEVDTPAELSETILEMPDFDKTMVIKAETTPEDIVFDVPDEANNDAGLDINFDLDLPASNSVTEDSISEMMDDLPPLENIEMTSPPELDLSGISLDLDAIPETETATNGEVADIQESSEVDTKLDLVTAYIDMGDTEGARELIEEVLKEGGPNQRKRAQEMLLGLG